MISIDDILERLKSRIARIPPDDCWIWTGAKTQPRVCMISKTRRDKDFLPERIPTVVKPYAVFKLKAKRTSVHRFLFGTANRIENHCGNTLCVHPDHWKIALGPMTKKKPFFDPDTEIEDARRVIDGIGIARNLLLDDLLTHPLLVVYSHAPIEKA